jgi:hypothetical protein
MVYTLDLSKVNVEFNSNKVYLEFTSSSKDDNSLLTINSYNGFTSTSLSNGMIVKFDSSIDNLVHLDSLNLNLDKLEINIGSKDLIGIKLVEFDGSNYNLIKSFGAPIESEVINNNNKFDKLQEGDCTLSLRILPPGKGNEISTAEQFDNYNPLGQDNIDTNVKQTDVITKQFSIAKTPDTKKAVSSFMITGVKENFIVCGKDKGRFDIDYIYQNSNNEDLNEILKWSVSLDRYSNKHNFNDGLISQGKNKINVNLGLSNDMVGDKGKIYDATLEYEVQKIDPNDDTKLIRVPGKYGSIKFKINTKKNCVDEEKATSVVVVNKEKDKEVINIG